VADPHETEKAAAARAAVGRVRPGMRLALGTGTTAAHAVSAIAVRFPDGGGLTCVASSERTEALARELHVPIRALEAGDRFDLMIDGADEVDPSLSLTKGGGGALFREKYLARRSQEFLVIVDPSKLVDHLGSRSAIPVEVVPYARDSLLAELNARGLPATVRPAADGQGTFRTDNGLEVLDVRPSGGLEDPGRLDAELHGFPGVVETGLFVGLANTVLIGRPDGSVEERKARGSR